MTPDLDISTSGSLGRITLNRPRAINALSLEMIEGITATLTAWQDDPAIGAVLFEGAGERGFCAGGDVRAIRTEVLAGAPERADAYFAAEYGMNGLIATYPKPLVVFAHGVVMGGGIGVAGHCRYRITQPGARYAMPESAIGFVPDVGANAILAKAPLNRALLFLMSGMTVGTADALALGLVDIAVAPDRINALRGDIKVAAGSANPGDAIGRLLAAEAIDAGDAAFCALADLLPAVAPSTPAEFVALVAEIPELADVSTLIATRSPGSVAAAFHAQLAARRLIDVRRTLDLEYRLAGHMVRRPDFAEGVRAVLVDKDQRPAWQPASLADLDDGPIVAIAESAVAQG